jgi:hypothetical protein
MVALEKRPSRKDYSAYCIVTAGTHKALLLSIAQNSKLAMIVAGVINHKHQHIADWAPR